MVRPALRSRSYRRICKRTPSGRTVVNYERRRKTLMRCARCGAVLNGVPITDDLRRKLPKSSKRPERIFGGVLCPNCLKRVLKSVVRGSVLK
uniref:Large ribosomal subunit protein eL34 n=1 Tax=Ignisphaera aggregans TaxID=334771 RepID=A0A7C4FHI6_9CREN